MNDVTEFNFSVDSALLQELGEKLVSTVHVALAELVKNAYDADATRVQVRFEASPPDSGPTIWIEDNGTGMTPADVAKFWMRIGTTNKGEEPRSTKYGRSRTGKKGVGRFACRRLGTKLRLVTIAQEESPRGRIRKVKTVVDFDWGQFLPGTLVEGVPCRGTTQELPQDHPTGTQLLISGAAEDEWQVRGFEYLRRQLAVMAGNAGAMREGYEEDPGFSVVLRAAESTHVDEPEKDLREQVIDASWGTLDAHVAPDGRAHFSLTAAGLGGRRTFTTEAAFGVIAGARLRIGILPATKTDGVRDPSLLANYVLAKLVEEWGGVQIRFNGFRMYPYGNQGDDWLHIDADRGRRLGRPDSIELINFASSLTQVDPSRVLLNMLGMRNYLGQVDVTSDIKGLEPRLDRQGFVESGAFESLRTFVRMAIEWSTIHREAYIRQKATSDMRQAVAELAPILDEDPRQLEVDAAPKATRFLKQEIGRLISVLPASEQAQTKQTLLKTIKALEAVSADNQNQLRHLRLVASTSTLTLLFAHEVRSAIAGIGAGSSRLRAIARKVTSHAPELTLLSQQLGSTQAQLTSLVEMTGIVGAFRTDKQTAEINISTAVDRSVSCFRLISNNYRISIDTSQVQSTLLTGPMIEGEIYTILINLLSNAIKSLIAKGGHDKLIKVWSELVGEKALLKIADNGLGLDPRHFTDVFTPFIADPSGLLYDKLQENANPEDEAAFGTGSGLGLSIARDIARARGGDIRFINPENDWSACVEVQLP
jgi:signal transduction histidine kinase